MKHLILLLRPQQWLKNLFIFLPIFFDKELFDLPSWQNAGLAFIAYCLAASSIYCFNDIWDVEADRLHPKKRLRPIASGAVGKAAAYWLAAGLVVASFAVCLWGLEQEKAIKVAGILLIYLLTNIAYCIRLKHIALVDVFIIALGFVWRILVGGFSTGIFISHWIVLMTFLLALFLAFAKRRDDVVIYEGTGVKARRNINRYNLSFMNQAISIVSTLSMMCYILYTVSEDTMRRMNTSFLYVTSVWVLLGFIRYLQLTIVDVKSGSPTHILMKDRFIQTSIICWLLTFFVLLYC